MSEPNILPSENIPISLSSLGASVDWHSEVPNEPLQLQQTARFFQGKIIDDFLRYRASDGATPQFGSLEVLSTSDTVCPCNTTTGSTVCPCSTTTSFVGIDAPQFGRR